MEERDDFLALPVDYGLYVKYDGKNNVVLYDDCPSYGIGEMMCELARMAPSDIKEIITAYEGFNDEKNDENLCKAFMWFEKELITKYGPAAGKILCSEFMGYSVHCLIESEREEWEAIVERTKEPDDAKINSFIFEGTGYEYGGDSSIGHILLTAYTVVALGYISFKYLFTNIMESCTGHEEGDEVALKAMDLFGALIGSQHIDFKIMALDGELASVYGIKTCISLLAFEFANAFNNNVLFSKCKNCGQYFVLTGRIDSVYCSMPAPDHPGKTCKDVGAQVTRANKEKTDITTAEYRKVYMKLKMQATRHPKDTELQDKIDGLVDAAKEWRKRMSVGDATSEEFLIWLEQYK